MHKNIKLKLARIQKDLSQEQLAEAVGFTRQTIGLIEAGKYNPSIRMHRRLQGAGANYKDERLTAEHQKLNSHGFLIVAENLWLLL